MKSLDRLVLKSYLRPLIPTLGIMVFFFLMQMVWKYVDDLAGKGIEWYVLLELMLYWAATVVPFALPVSVLFAALFAFGNFGENYELAAMKSSGISLFRAMRPLIYLNFALAIGAFYFYNNVIPVANLKGQSLLLNITRSKPAFNIIPGIFYKGLDGYSIKIGGKSGDNDEILSEVFIYDHSENKKGNQKVLSASSGIMQTTNHGQVLEIQLFDGAIYEDVFKRDKKERLKMPFVHTTFDTTMIRFSLLDFSQTDLYKERRKDFMMMDIAQLESKADTLAKVLENRNKDFKKTFKGKYKFDYISLNPEVQNELPKANVLDNLSRSMRVRASQNAIRLARSNLEFLKQIDREFSWRQENWARHWIEYFKKFSLGISVLIMFFIGAPMGSIIRKGGIGLPMVISTIAFLIYHILNTTFDKMGRELILTPFEAVLWPILILIPIAAWLTRSAAMDRPLLSGEWYARWREKKK